MSDYKPFSGLHIQVDEAALLPDGGVLAVGQRAGLPRAQTGEVPLVSAKLLFSRAVRANEK
jgi:hypothetical protein